MKGLTDKRVVITGGAGGIGTTTAACFHEEGARIIIMDMDQKACQRIESKYQLSRKASYVMYLLPTRSSRLLNNSTNG